MGPGDVPNIWALDGEVLGVLSPKTQSLGGHQDSGPTGLVLAQAELLLLSGHRPFLVLSGPYSCLLALGPL